MRTLGFWCFVRSGLLVVRAFQVQPVGTSTWVHPPSTKLTDNPQPERTATLVCRRGSQTPTFAATSDEEAPATQYPPKKLTNPQTDVRGLDELKASQYFGYIVKASRRKDQKLLNEIIGQLEQDATFMRMEAGITPDIARIQDALIQAASRCGMVKFADKLFEVLMARGSLPTRPTLGALLQAHRSNMDVNGCKRLLQRVVAAGMDVGVVSANTVLAALVDAGRMEEAVEFLESMKTLSSEPRDLASFSTVASAAARIGDAQTVRLVQRSMRAAGLPDDVAICSSVIHAEISRGQFLAAQREFEAVLAQDPPAVEMDVCIYNIGINAYTKSGNLTRAFEIMDLMRSAGVLPRADTYNSVLSALIKRGRTEDALRMFQDQMFPGNNTRPGVPSVRPSRVTYNLMLDGLEKAGRASAARALYKDMCSQGEKPDCYTIRTMVRVQDSAAGVYKILTDMHRSRVRPNHAVFNSAIRSLGEHGDLIGACQLFDKMVRMGVLPDTCTYNSLLFCLVHRRWVVSPLPTPATDSDIALRMGNSTGLLAALSLLQDMKADPVTEPDHITYTTVIRGVTRAHEERLNRVAEGGTAVPVGRAVDAAALREKLFEEALSREVNVNGQLCNAMLLGFGTDIEGALRFWKTSIKPIALARQTRGAPKSLPRECMEAQGDTELYNFIFKEDFNLPAAYMGLVHLCGRAHRPDMALQIVKSMRLDGLKVGALFINVYMAAKLAHVHGDRMGYDGPLAKLSPRNFLLSQSEKLLEIECGLHRRSRTRYPIQKIRIKL